MDPWEAQEYLINIPAKFFHGLFLGGVWGGADLFLLKNVLRPPPFPPVYISMLGQNLYVCHVVF